MPVVLAQGLKSSPSSPRHALLLGEGCICPGRCLSLNGAHVLQWQACIKIFVHFGECDKGPGCLPLQLRTQATATPVTLLTLRLVWEVAESKGQEAVAQERTSQQLSNDFQ